MSQRFIAPTNSGKAVRSKGVEREKVIEQLRGKMPIMVIILSSPSARAVPGLARAAIERTRATLRGNARP